MDFREDLSKVAIDRRFTIGDKAQYYMGDGIGMRNFHALGFSLLWLHRCVPLSVDLLSIRIGVFDT